MDQEIINIGSIIQYPLLILPKNCTDLETNYKLTDNVLIDLNITSQDTEGNETIIFNGLCNVKLIDNYDLDVQALNWSNNNEPFECIEGDNIPIILTDAGSSNAGSSYPVYTQSQVWIDPSRSPYVYNHYNPSQTHHYAMNSVYQTHTKHITVEQHNTYITQNIYNYKESEHYSPVEESEYKRQQKNQNSDQHTGTESYSSPYEEDELECGVFLSQLPDEIMNEKEVRAREERKYIGLNSENSALRQLMSSDIQSMSKQRKTILFLGHDSHYGQTIQKITVNDPLLHCVGNADRTVVDEITPEILNPNQKRYQCDKCMKIFDQITAFKQHMYGNHKTLKSRDNESTSNVKYVCSECGKTLKSQRKFEIHCLGHGDPELECNKCHKVFASKFTLRTHRKIHSRKFQCSYCSKFYTTSKLLNEHKLKTHHNYTCDYCGYATARLEDLEVHRQIHQDLVRDASDTEFAESLMDDGISESDINVPSPKQHDSIKVSRQEVEDANSVIAKVMSNKVFLLHAKKARKHRKYNKVCDVCFKSFDRIDDLKRHLIEHIIRSTLAKTPVTSSGALNLQCEVCQQESFSKIDKYKAHLREHAKLTLYKCTFCDKSFSDSSNFSKHKKIHGSMYFQCDLCQRKFNSKKMIAQHMEYHTKNEPLPCKYCNKVFHFESKLNKHIKSVHTKEPTARYRCRFCQVYFKSLKEKWDHEWRVHNVRSYIVDCLMCGSKFRKYSELKRHCLDLHGVDIPPAKELLKKEVQD